jgi:energy-coupling factor transporter ATP-binding protein EcfA2
MNTRESEPFIQVQGLSYKPMGVDHFILKDINLDIYPGDFALLLGPPGCGKSMLTRCLNGIIPHLDEGELQGEVVVEGKNTRTSKIYEFATKIGMVFQNPDDQIVSLKVLDEVAWGVENLGLEHDEIKQRVFKFMDLLAISHLKDRLTFAISGGQKQKVSIASNLAMLQDVLVLDDPTTDLDPVCKMEVVQALRQLHQEMGKTLIVIEHDLSDLIEMANRMIIMEDGRVAHDGSPEELVTEHYDDLVRLGVNIHQACPAHKEDAFAVLNNFVQDHRLPPAEARKQEHDKGEAVISVRDLEFAYQANMPILKGINFDIYQGEFVAIVGANGSGKSTLVNNFTGLLVPDKGQIIINGHDTRKVKVSDLTQDIGYVFQNPDHQLFSNTVADEVGFSLKLRDVPPDEIEKRVTETLKFVQLDQFTQRHPYSLSRGQRQKLAVATALIHQPSVILLDEPTTGQDRHSLSGLLALMTRLNRQGNTTIMITHDMDIVAAYATRVLVMVDGQIMMDGHPIDIFYDNFDTLSQLNLRPPAVIDFCRRLEDQGIPRCLTVEELVAFLKEVDIGLAIH